MTKETKQKLMDIAIQLLDSDLADSYTAQSIMLVVGGDTLKSQRQVNALLRPFNEFYKNNINEKARTRPASK